MKLYETTLENSKCEYEWKDFHQDCFLLRKLMADEKFDAIVCITKGGMMLGYEMAKAMEVGKIETVSCFRDKGKITLNKGCGFLGAEKILILDELSDRGDTFLKVINNVTESNSKAEIKTASLMIKQGTKHVPNYYVRVLPANCRIDYFWERTPDLAKGPNLPL